MSNILDQIELDGLRIDFFEMLGLHDTGTPTTYGLRAFTDEFTGTTGPWNSAVWTDADFNGTGSIDLSANQGRMKNPGVASNYGWEHIETKSSHGDAEVVFKFRRVSAPANNIFNVVMRHSGVWSEGTFQLNTPVNSYLLVIQGTLIRMFRVVGSVKTAISDSYSITISTGVDYWCRMRVEGNEIKAKVWESGSGEPAWQIETTDSNFSSGVLSLQADGYDGAHEFLIDSLTVTHLADSTWVDDSAKTTVIITRILDGGSINSTTGLYDAPISAQIYVGPAHISPVTYRRDRQELGGGEAIRIRQYRAIVPWNAGDIWIDDLLTVSDTTDPDMIGKTFEISDVLYESELGVRRISLTDTSRDGEGVNC